MLELKCVTCLHYKQILHKITVCMQMHMENRANEIYLIIHSFIHPFICDC